MPTSPQEPDFFKFLRILYKFQSILRAVYIKDKDAQESDAEHSFQLAMFVWYINQKHSKGLNSELLIKYSLVHDLVELYAGDTDSLISKKSVLNSKNRREMKSLARLKKEITDFPELFNLIHAYETHADPESNFVYAVDKMIPFVIAYFSNQKDYYQKNKLSYSGWKPEKQKKISQADPALLDEPVIKELFEFLGSLKGFYYEEKHSS